jgi:hypothetical protein
LQFDSIVSGSEAGKGDRRGRESTNIQPVEPSGQSEMPGKKEEKFSLPHFSEFPFAIVT